MRPDQWDKRLHVVLTDRLKTPFAWGENDCATFAAACVEAMTGVNHLQGMPTWSDEASALAAIEEVGGMKPWLDSHFEPINPLTAQRGDLGLVGTALNVCVGRGWASPSSDGLAVTPLGSASEAWRV